MIDELNEIPKFQFHLDWAAEIRKDIAFTQHEG